MRLELENLGKDWQFAHTYQPSELSLEDADLRLIEPAEVRGRIRRKGDEVELTGSLRTTLETLCARCLKPVAITPSLNRFTMWILIKLLWSKWATQIRPLLWAYGHW